jgi:hypothetical protein
MGPLTFSPMLAPTPSGAYFGHWLLALNLERGM